MNFYTGIQQVIVIIIIIIIFIIIIIIFIVKFYTHQVSKYKKDLTPR